jgi:hypothetical protein
MLLGYSPCQYQATIVGACTIGVVAIPDVRWLKPTSHFFALHSINPFEDEADNGEFFGGGSFFE